MRKFLYIQILDVTCLLLLLVHYCLLFVPVSVFNLLAGSVILFLAHCSVAGICAVYLTHTLTNVTCYLIYCFTLLLYFDVVKGGILVLCLFIKHICRQCVNYIC